MLSQRLDSLALRGAGALARCAPGFAAAGLERPWFLIGCGRSGSSLLRRLLSRHPQLAVLPSEANGLWHPQAYPWTAADVDVPPLWVDPHRFTDFSIARCSEVDQRRRRALFGAFQRLRRGRCFVNKSVMIHFMLPTVARWFPEARFLHLFRDGRAVALSRAKRLISRADEAPNLPNQRSLDELLDESARYWRLSILAIEEAAPDLAAEDRYMEISYEELCADPPRALQRIAECMGINTVPFQDLDPAACENRNHKFRNELDAATVDRMSQIMQPALAGKGYRPASQPQLTNT